MVNELDAKSEESYKRALTEIFFLITVLYSSIVSHKDTYQSQECKETYNQRRKAHG